MNERLQSTSHPIAITSDAEPANPETATLIGERGEQLLRNLGMVIVGKKKISALGPGCDRAPDGTLRLVVDEASYRALELDR